MPWSYPTNVPSFAKNKTEEEQNIAVDSANSILEKGGSEEDAIFSAISAVKAHNRRKSQKKALNSPKRNTPSHIASLISRDTTPTEESCANTDTVNLNIRKEFLGKNALPVGKDRNLVSVELKENLQLYHVFDTGEKIITDLSRLQSNVENYVSFSSSSESLKSKSVVVNTVADTPTIVVHGLNLFDPDALIVQATYNGHVYSLDVQILDGNSVEILTYFDTTGLRLNFLVVDNG